MLVKFVVAMVASILKFKHHHHHPHPNRSQILILYSLLKKTIQPKQKPMVPAVHFRNQPTPNLSQLFRSKILIGRKLWQCHLDFFFFDSTFFSPHNINIYKWSHGVIDSDSTTINGAMVSMISNLFIKGWGLGLVPTKSHIWSMGLEDLPTSGLNLWYM